MTQIFFAKRKRMPHLLDVLFLLFIILLIFLLFVNSDTIKEKMLSTFLLGYKSLIPSLFPFMILSGVCTHFLFASKDDSDKASSNAKRSSYWFALILSILFGFPIGAGVVHDLYNNGKVNLGIANRLFPLANQTGFAFVCLVLGRDFLGAPLLGIKIYSIMLSSALLVYLLYKGKRNERYSLNKSVASSPFSILQIIKNATINMVYIIGFLVAFSIPTAIFDAYFYGKPISLFFAVILEISNGCSSVLQMLPSPSPFRIPLLCFCVSFGGLCVGMQSQMCILDSPLSMREYYIRKFLQGILAFCLAFLIA